ncbi:TetR/AcrR family transcriptional regulator [Pseudoxanthomonas taiwanensis]|uniref:TetR family transcriptional regulator n=2 Tax=Pseudoxanthomonas TaxID=83618 RepID=A0A562CZ21_9GAMM|nr:TetR/AcrR family transcriptional regulator [Pseudoxanthomonas taiwanensis]TWH02727.1 TetR family transcriptional regulator [Pseudoxanthomonas taiwanensis J19]
MNLPAPATAKGAHTRDMLLSRACELAARVGLEGVSIGELANAAGMSKSGVFAHFGSREDLVRQTLEWAAAGFTDQVLVPALRRPRGLPRLQAVIEGWMDWILAHPDGCVFLGAISEYDGRPGPMREFVTELMERWRGVVETAVRKAVEEGHLRPGTDPKLLAFELHGLMYGLHHVRLHDPQAPELARRALHDLFDRYRADAGPATPPR